jgi:hypothetical protein
MGDPPSSVNSGRIDPARRHSGRSPVGVTPDPHAVCPAHRAIPVPCEVAPRQRPAGPGRWPARGGGDERRRPERARGGWTAEPRAKAGGGGCAVRARFGPAMWPSWAAARCCGPRAVRPVSRAAQHSETGGPRLWHLARGHARAGHRKVDPRKVFTPSRIRNQPCIPPVAEASPREPCSHETQFRSTEEPLNCGSWGRQDYWVCGSLHGCSVPVAAR